MVAGVIVIVVAVVVVVVCGSIGKLLMLVSDVGKRCQRPFCCCVAMLVSDT